MRYIQGTDRDQVTLLPEAVDDFISEENPVRFIDAFVDNLDLEELEFKYSTTKETGRKPYDPRILLKLYIYGYLNRIRSSRMLEKATHRNLELIWLLQKLSPDFKTIADFRRDNKKSLKKVFRQFTVLCKKLDLFGCELIAIDGSKFRACNSKDKNYTKTKLKRLINKIDEKVNGYLEQLENGDQTEESVSNDSADELKAKIESLGKKKDEYQRLQKTIDESDQSQVSLTDPDSRMMRTRQGNAIAYNVQIATDNKHKLVVAFDVTNDCNDQRQLSSMALAAKKELGVDSLTSLTDAGYWQRENIKDCTDANIECYVARPQKSKSQQENLFTYRDFKYDSQQDCYWCPAGKKLEYNGIRVSKSGQRDKSYWTLECKNCKIKSKCTRDSWVRRINRWEFEDIIEQAEKRAKKDPDKMKLRKALVEHPFGTLKRGMGQGYFLTRGIDNVTGEMSLSLLSYNIKRVLNIVNFKELMLAIQ